MRGPDEMTDAEIGLVRQLWLNYPQWVGWVDTDTIDNTASTLIDEGIVLREEVTANKAGEFRLRDGEPVKALEQLDRTKKLTCYRLSDDLR